MASRAREACQPVRQTVLFLVLLQKMSPSDTFLVASRKHRPHPIYRSLQAPPASACEGLIELGNCDRVPRENGVEADKRFFSFAGGHKRHFVL